MINLVSDESDESDDDGQGVDTTCCRRGLFTAQSRLYDENGRRHRFLGLFTTRAIKTGEFIGFYTGEWWSERSYKRLRNRRFRDEFAIQTSDDWIVSPPLVNGRPDPYVHPLAMANEPSEHGEANAFLVEYTFCFDELEDGLDADVFGDDDFSALGLVACRDIGRNREILWTYGGNYPRKYVKGKNCKRPRRLEDPTMVFDRIPLCAVSHPIR